MYVAIVTDASIQEGDTHFLPWSASTPVVETARQGWRYLADIREEEERTAGRRKPTPTLDRLRQAASEIGALYSPEGHAYAVLRLNCSWPGESDCERPATHFRPHPALRMPGQEGIPCCDDHGAVYVPLQHGSRFARAC